MALSKPVELEAGRKYRILSGEGEGVEGHCTQIRESDFGHKWGLITPEEGDSHWSRWILLEALDD